MRIRLFGGLEVNQPSGEPIRFSTRKSALIIAALALAGPRGMRRELLAETMWPSREPEQARNSLRQALVEIRRLLAAGGPNDLSLKSGPDTLALHAGPGDVDTWEFGAKVEAGAAADLALAASLYRGGLLAEGSLPGDLEGWILPYRERYRRKAWQLVEELSRSLSESGSAEEQACVALAGRLLEEDAAAEAAHRALIRIFRRRGQDNLARRQFEMCRKATRELLGTEPEAQTRGALDEVIENGISPSVPSISAQAGYDERPEGDVPSVAVLPFLPLSPGSEEDYFAAGVIEEITTALSRFGNLVVIVPGPAFSSEARRSDAGHAGRALGARYLVEGSVRRSGERLRITGKLVRAATGATLWSDRFDGTLADVLDLQERIALDIVGAIAPKVEAAEIERARQKPTSSLDAYDLYLRGIALFDRPAVTRDSIDGALDLFKRAIDRDGEFAAAHARAARCFATYKSNRWFTDAGPQTAEGVRFATQAIRHGRDDAVALSYAGFVVGYVGGDLEECASCVDRAIALNPNLTVALGYRSWVKVCLGEPEGALDDAVRAIGLSPMDSRLFAWQFCAALASLCIEDYAAAADWATKAIRSRANYVSAIRIAAASYALAGRMTEANAMVKQLVELDSALRLANLDQVLPPLRRAEDRRRIFDGLRQAGLDK